MNKQKKQEYQEAKEFFDFIFQKDVELKHEENYRKYLLAILIKSLLHDIGHGPFSHSLETICNWRHGFHEKIGDDIIKEHMQKVLEETYPGLSDAMEEITEKDPIGLKILIDGTLDVDRGDFIGYHEPKSRATEYLFKIFGEKLIEVQGENYKLKEFLQAMKNIINLQNQKTQINILIRIA